MPYLLDAVYLGLVLILLPRGWSIGASARASTARAGPRSSGGWSPGGSATARASGSTPSASARSCCSGRSSPSWRGGGPAGRSSSRRPRRPAWRWPGGPSPSWSPSTPRSTSAGRPAGPSSGSGRRCWSWSRLELWPNLIRAAKRAGAAGGDRQRPAERAGATAAIAGSEALLGPTLRRLDLVAAQSEESPDRFLDLGVPADRVVSHRLGQVRRPGGDRQTPRRPGDSGGRWGSTGDAPVFVAGSTMEGEEAAALAAYRAARRDHPGLRLVLVPRHPERGFEHRPLARGRGGDRSGGGAPRTRPAGRRARRRPAGPADRHGRRAVERLGPGRRGLRRREPASGPGRPEHDGARGLRGVGPVRAAHAATSARRSRACSPARPPSGSPTPAGLAGRPAIDAGRPGRGPSRGAAARSFVLAQRGATERTLAPARPAGRAGPARPGPRPAVAGRAGGRHRGRDGRLRRPIRFVEVRLDPSGGFRQTVETPGPDRIESVPTRRSGSGHGRPLRAARRRSIRDAGRPGPEARPARRGPSTHRFRTTHSARSDL